MHQRPATGQYVDAYAQEHLFGPLGIQDYHWKRSPRGFPDTEGGLYLEAEDLAKIGYLYLTDGIWDGQRILPEGWVEASTTRHAEVPGPVGWGYGYQWWLLEIEGVEVWAGNGFGDQSLLVIPELGLVGPGDLAIGGGFETPVGSFSHRVTASHLHDTNTRAWSTSIAVAAGTLALEGAVYAYCLALAP